MPAILYHRYTDHWLQTMKQTVLCFAIFFLPAAWWQVSAVAQESRLQALEWMLGSWSCDRQDGVLMEEWSKVSPNTFEGVDYSKNAGKEQPTETLRLVEMSGDIFYIAKVSHNPQPVAFKLMSADDRSARFENREHDFPIQITYRREGDTAMTVTVEGASREGFQLRFNRVNKTP